jgi:hypothetical protein
VPAVCQEDVALSVSLARVSKAKPRGFLDFAMTQLGCRHVRDQSYDQAAAEQAKI